MPSLNSYSPSSPQKPAPEVRSIGDLETKSLTQNATVSDTRLTRGKFMFVSSVENLKEKCHISTHKPPDLARTLKNKSLESQISWHFLYEGHAFFHPLFIFHFQQSAHSLQDLCHCLRTMTSILCQHVCICTCAHNHTLTQILINQSNKHLGNTTQAAK